jgi:Spy/CpxP family protein refolding chaperone
MNRNIFKAAVLSAALAATGAFAQGPGYGYGYGPGMMGSGMMGGGPGYGAGMMGGGPGYGSGGIAALDLSDEQRTKVLAIQEDNRRKNWQAMGDMRGEMFKLRNLYYAEKADSKAILEQQKKVDELRRQMLSARLESRKQVEQVLTPEQRKRLRGFGPWWLHDEDE